MAQRAKRERNREMADLYRAGWTLMEVGHCYGISDMRVWQILKRIGVQTRRRGWWMKSRAA